MEKRSKARFDKGDARKDDILVRLSYNKMQEQEQHNNNKETQTTT